jgi:hypothetical protein
MGHSLKLIAAWGVFASMALVGAAAASPIAYTVDMRVFGNFGGGNDMLRER